MDAICQCHDNALEMIGAKIRHAVVRAKSGAELRLNQMIPEYAGAALQLYFVLRNVAAKTMVIADLVVIFEIHSAGARHSLLQLMDGCQDTISRGSRKHAEGGRIQNLSAIAGRLNTTSRSQASQSPALSASRYGSRASSYHMNFLKYGWHHGYNLLRPLQLLAS